MLPRLRASCARHPLLCVAAALLASMACLSVSCDDLAADTVRLFVAAALMGALAFAAGWLRPVCSGVSTARFFVPFVSFAVVLAAVVTGFSSAVSLFADFGGVALAELSKRCVVRSILSRYGFVRGNPVQGHCVQRVSRGVSAGCPGFFASRPFRLFRVALHAAKVDQTQYRTFLRWRGFERVGYAFFGRARARFRPSVRSGGDNVRHSACFCFE